MSIFCNHTFVNRATLKGYPSRIYFKECTKCGKLYAYDKFEDRTTRLTTLLFDNWDFDFEKEKIE